MTQLPPGRYERLIDQQLREQLQDLEACVQVGKVDAAEAPGALLRFWRRILSARFRQWARSALRINGSCAIRFCSYLAQNRVLMNQTFWI